MQKMINPMKGILREILITIALAAVLYLLLHLVVQSSIVENVSMQPGLVEGQRLIVVKAAYWFGQLQRGDVIIIYPPIEPEKQWVKRLIGLPGDTVEVRDGVVRVNSVPLNEPYIKALPDYNFPAFTVPEDQYFVLGDNRNESADSHYGWTITRQEIVGKAWLRFWPLDKWGLVNNVPLNEQVESGKINIPALTN
jgi:signal peptidase I